MQTARETQRSQNKKMQDAEYGLDTVKQNYQDEIDKIEEELNGVHGDPAQLGKKEELRKFNKSVSEIREKINKLKTSTKKMALGDKIKPCCTKKIDFSIL